MSKLERDPYMTCTVCGHGIEGDEGKLRVRITAVGELPAELRLPDGGIDNDLCMDCWRWTRNLADDPAEVLPAGVLEAAEVPTND